MEDYNNLGISPCSTIFAPAEVFPDKGTIYSNIKGEEMQMFSVFDCIALHCKDTYIMPKKQGFDAKCVAVYL